MGVLGPMEVFQISFLGSCTFPTRLAAEGVRSLCATSIGVAEEVRCTTVAGPVVKGDADRSVHRVEGPMCGGPVGGCRGSPV